MVIVEPSDFEFHRVLDSFSRRQDDDFDMEIVNELYGKDCMIIPHRRYNLITGEFHEKEHHRYPGSKEEIWDPQKVLEEAEFVHFFDWPLRKPWLPHTEEAYVKFQAAGEKKKVWTQKHLATPCVSPRGDGRYL